MCAIDQCFKPLPRCHSADGAGGDVVAGAGVFDRPIQQASRATAAVRITTADPACALADGVADPRVSARVASLVGTRLTLARAACVTRRTLCWMELVA